MNNTSQGRYVLFNSIIVTATLLLTLLFTIGCSKHVATRSESFLFLGHIYQPNVEDSIDRRLSGIRFTEADWLLLGGDLCVETTRNPATLYYLDSIFDLSSESTLWAVGNHDVRSGNTELISEFTKRPLHYLQKHDRILFVVLNTNYTSTQCDVLEDQYEMFEGALLEDVDHIIILSHHAIWTSYLLDRGEEFQANAVHGIWRAHCRNDQNTFVAQVLPELQKVAENGIEIHWVAGDYGQRTGTHKYQIGPNLTLWGSGIDKHRSQPDSLLLITSAPPVLTFEFKSIDDVRAMIN